MSNNRILTDTKLNQYFFKRLSELNTQITNPLNQEILFYSSEVLNKFALSRNLFEKSQDGRLRDKFLGLNLIETELMDADAKRRRYQDIAETSLFLCGYFSNSLEQKLFNPYHYHKVGVSAFERLDAIVPQFLGVPAFYKTMANKFHQVSDLLAVVASKDKSDPLKHFLAS